jgi:dihydrofolate reductase
MKVTLYMAMTVNGYIATLEDETPWSDEVWEAYYAFVKARPAVIVGRRTYEFMRVAGEFQKLDNPFTAVVSHEPKVIDEKTVGVSSVDEALQFMESKEVSEVVVGGGGELNASFLKAGLLDEIVLEVDPVIFGQGIQLFDPVEARLDLELIEVKHLSKNTVRLHYRVLR